MEKRVNKYTIIYAVEFILNIILTVLIIYAFHSVEVGDCLEGAFNLGFTMLHFLILMLILLVLCMVFTAVFMILSVTALKRYRYRRLMKFGTILIPVMFILLLQFAGGFVLIKHSHSGQASPEELCSDSKFEELQEQYISTYLTYYNKSNMLGKAVDLIQSVYIPSNDIDSFENNNLAEYDDWRYECLYRKSNSSIMFNKFIKYEINPNRYEMIKTDDYIVYYSILENNKEYIMVIETENTYFYSYFNSGGLRGSSDYILSDFIEDGLMNYRLWNENNE